MAGGYRLGAIKQNTDSAYGGRLRYVFGVIGRPLVHLAFETEEQAVAAHQHMDDVCAAD
jgi:hypothetical protein